MNSNFFLAALSLKRCVNAHKAQNSGSHIFLLEMSYFEMSYLFCWTRTFVLFSFESKDILTYPGMPPG